MPALLTKSVLGLVVLVALCGAARGEERLMMPFSCKIEHGNVVLVPSQTQPYRIYGAREHRRFTTCSPARPDRCRSWTVHRFDLDCGGVRIGWPSVVAAMAPWARGADRTYAGRAPQGMGPWAMGPQHMGPQHIGPQHIGPQHIGPQHIGPRRYARPPLGAPRPYGPPRRYVARPPAPRQMVDLPAGFAPVPSRLAHFVRLPGPARLGPIARKNAAPAAAAIIAANETSNAPAGSSAASASKQIDSSLKPAKAAGFAVARQAKSDRLALAAPRAGNDITSALPNPRKAQPGSSWFNPTGAAGVGFAAFVILAMMLFLSKRAKGVHLTVPLMRGLAEGGPPFPGATPQPTGAPSSRPRQAASPRPPRARDPDWLPSTRSEALEVLGAGSETGADMLKAIVKRLRRTWHPDHAAHEEDRQTRERRLKQINVAWDIVCGKRRARHRSFTSQEC